MEIRNMARRGNTNRAQRNLGRLFRFLHFFRYSASGLACPHFGFRFLLLNASGTCPRVPSSLESGLFMSVMSGHVSPTHCLASTLASLHPLDVS